jgi:hypothetical protein
MVAFLGECWQCVLGLCAGSACRQCVLAMRAGIACWQCAPAMRSGNRGRDACCAWVLAMGAETAAVGEGGARHGACGVRQPTTQHHVRPGSLCAVPPASHTPRRQLTHRLPPTATRSTTHTHTHTHTRARTHTQAMGCRRLPRARARSARWPSSARPSKAARCRAR